jgi:hypothetical protein
MAVTKRKNSRQKGKRGELDAAESLRRLFCWTARRTQQFKGTSDSSDVEVAETPEAFWEVKREERLNVFKALATAVAEAGGKLPVLMHRKNKTEWLVTVRLADLARLSEVVRGGLERVKTRGEESDGPGG